jgi:glycine oxidase
MRREIYDVVVVGAGIVGCSTAYHLARSGVRVAIVDKGGVAEEASQAAAGMLALAGNDPPDREHPLQQLSVAALRYYDDLDEQLRQETGVDIGLADVPTLRPAFDEPGSTRLRAILTKQQPYLPGLQWLDASAAREVEPVLPETVQGALLSPQERNVQAAQITLAYARGAAIRGARLLEGCPVGRLILQGERAAGVETAQGPIRAGAVVLAAGAWAAQWHVSTSTPPIFPVKGQMLALRALPGLHLRHTVYATGVGGIVPKPDGTIAVGATVEQVGFDKAVTADGIATLLAAVAKLTPGLGQAHVLRMWAGLRPGSADGLPLIGPSQSVQELWVAGGHFRDGILLGPLTGQIVADLMQQRPPSCDVDLKAFDPDRFGGWSSARRIHKEAADSPCRMERSPNQAGGTALRSR